MSRRSPGGFVDCLRPQLAERHPLTFSINLSLVCLPASGKHQR
ncbi:MAG: hypothetical protein RIN56_13060 [Sporomusaceae bacterium]|nr:hypothetical protein [Sporomusaceae bacterium]